MLVLMKEQFNNFLYMMGGLVIESINYIFNQVRSISYPDQFLAFKKTMRKDIDNEIKRFLSLKNI